MKLYHVAPRSARESVAADGLVGGSTSERWSLRSEPVFGVFGWDTLAAAEEWAARDLAAAHEPTVDVWEMSVDEDDAVVDPQIEIDPSYAGSWVVLVDEVPSGDLRLVDTRRSGRR